MIILSTLKSKQLSGYEIISFIYDSFKVLLSSGTVYPTLAGLEKKGLITSTNLERKRIYRLTHIGETSADMFILEYSKFNEHLRLLFRSSTDEQVDDRARSNSGRISRL